MQNPFPRLLTLALAAAALWTLTANRQAQDTQAYPARDAYERFQAANQNGGKGVYAPDRINHDDEKFADVWGYADIKPFVVFFEKSSGRGEAEFTKAFAPRAAMLCQLEAWFREILIKPLELKRALPIEGPVTSTRADLKDREFSSPGELAEAEGRPFEIVLFEDQASYRDFLKDYSPGSNLRAHYSMPLAQAVSYDDSGEKLKADDLRKRNSILILEIVHLLAHHYAANPIAWEQVSTYEFKPKEDRPRYFNLLLEAGLPEAIAGFTQSGEGETAKFSFLELNTQRAKDWQTALTEYTNRKVLFRVQDLLLCQSRDDCPKVGLKRWFEIGKSAKAQATFYTAVYYACATQAVYFFHHFKEDGKYKYRDKWWAYVKADFTSPPKKKGAEAGIKAFKNAFGIKDDKDYDTINEELARFTQALKP